MNYEKRANIPGLASFYGPVGIWRRPKVIDDNPARHPGAQPQPDIKQKGNGMKSEDFILFSGGAKGAEAAFGDQAERYGVEEVNFTFEGHSRVRERGLRFLNHEELKHGDVSLEYVATLMHRRYTDSRKIRKVLQSIWYQVNSAQQIFVVGEVLADDTVKGGTGWGAEFAKLCNKPLFVFDQKRDAWFRWDQMGWTECPAGDEPVISHVHFAGTGTRFLQENGKQAIDALFARSFGQPLS
jgi:hypothetical protein